MNKPLQIGITGGIGSGKTLVCKIFEKLGVPVYDADSHAKDLMSTDEILVKAIRKEFSDRAYHPDGRLDRVYMANHVFNDRSKLELLNSLVHPRVRSDYESWAAKHQDYPYILKEAALIFEASTHQALAKIIVVSAPEELRVKRVQIRDPHRSVEQIREIVEKQMPEAEKLKRADYIIVNDESRLILPQVLKLHQEFMGKEKQN